jgi:hypothetical protein
LFLELRNPGVMSSADTYKVWGRVMSITLGMR